MGRRDRRRDLEEAYRLLGIDDGGDPASIKANLRDLATLRAMMQRIPGRERPSLMAIVVALHRLASAERRFEKLRRFVEGGMGDGEDEPLVN